MVAMLPGALATFRRMLIAHLSDLHLMRGPLAAGPAAGLADAIGRLLSVEPRPDCVVITGDLADTGHPDEYDYAEVLADRAHPLPDLAAA
jgi:3',5'-cyclic AMP phosphodiesterase CpdA